MPKKFVTALFLIFFPLSLQAINIEDIQLPDMGDSSGTLISPLQEKELGDAFFRSLHSKIKINQDPEIQHYIQSIGRQLVANSDLPSSPFHFFVVLDKKINAFAGPGGYIGINAGLFLLTEAESELASVIAHEVAHVTQRHLYRAFEATSKLSIPTVAVTLAAILLGTQSHALGQAALVAIQAGSVQFQIDFTRDNEKEADRVGMKTLSKSSFNPRSMPAFFERLQQSTRYYSQGLPEFLRTHPVSSSRIADTRGRANKYGYKQYPDSHDYLLTRVKLRVMIATDSKQVLKYFQIREQQGTKEQRAITRYGVALAQMELQNFSSAKHILQQLTTEYPNQAQYAYAFINLAIASNNYSDAIKLLHKYVTHFPSNQAIKIKYISILLETGNIEKAKTILQSLDYASKKRPLYYELMAQSYAKSDQAAESRHYLAEYYYAMGHTQSAILQIKLAKKAKGINFYLQAILDERLQFFINEERERKLNQ
ncbi:MAG: M48 family metallopeptidase [Methylococcales symbiont of Hymedesmia sp. n. MRB-2018]|nr:MAG: M48 family metallopeptidase [Methylococcales symbiont of Hymedesmia sp. n. MRB-2018]KAF3983106.1 MAG: M48 family metallopeptidase [Methylococcales symbiont of Hymedesmia sp. n. MRB-2018]